MHLARKVSTQIRYINQPLVRIIVFFLHQPARNEDCEKALDLINEILEKEGFSKISKTGPPPKESTSTSPTNDEANNETGEEEETEESESENKKKVSFYDYGKFRK